MTNKTLLAPQVKSLISGISDQGSQHLTEVETDLVQTTFLLGEAIQKLGASFMAIHEAVCSQQEAMDLFMSGGVPTPENMERLKAIHIEIGKHVNSAVTGLQFQDMTSQLIGRTVRRVTGLREVLSMISDRSVELASESESEDIAVFLSDLNSTVEERSTKLESVMWKAVCQTHMESGDVELF